MAVTRDSKGNITSGTPRPAPVRPTGGNSQLTRLPGAGLTPTPRPGTPQPYQRQPQANVSQTQQQTANMTPSVQGLVGKSPLTQGAYEQQAQTQLQGGLSQQSQDAATRASAQQQQVGGSQAIEQMQLQGDLRLQELTKQGANETQLAQAAADNRAKEQQATQQFQTQESGYGRQQETALQRADIAARQSQLEYGNTATQQQAAQQAQLQEAQDAKRAGLNTADFQNRWNMINSLPPIDGPSSAQASGDPQGMGAPEMPGGAQGIPGKPRSMGEPMPGGQQAVEQPQGDPRLAPGWQQPEGTAGAGGSSRGAPSDGASIRALGQVNGNPSLANTGTNESPQAMGALQGQLGTGAPQAQANASNLPPEEAAARNAAFGRAKDRQGQTARASIDSLRGVMSETGNLGGGQEAAGIGAIVGGAAGGMGEFERDQLMSDQSRIGQVADRTYAGNLQKRQQDIGYRQSLIGLMGSGRSLY